MFIVLTTIYTAGFFQPQLELFPIWNYSLYSISNVNFFALPTSFHLNLLLSSSIMCLHLVSVFFFFISFSLCHTLSPEISEIRHEKLLTAAVNEWGLRTLAQWCQSDSVFPLMTGNSVRFDVQSSLCSCIILLDSPPQSPSSNPPALYLSSILPKFPLMICLVVIVRLKDMPPLHQRSWFDKTSLVFYQ